MNDLETTAYGILFLKPEELECLHRGEPRRGNRAVIAAGTGLGQAILFWDGQRYRPSATEGGHVDFAPRNDFEAGLFLFLRRRFPRVSYERVLSGPGLLNIFQYLESCGRPVEPAIAGRMKEEDPGAVIGQAGMDGTSAICAEALDVFVSVYGSQAGNLGLSAMAVGGIYVGGGIVTRILPRIVAGPFMEAFRDKGRSSVLLERMPVHAVLNDRASLIGASRVALEMAAG
jgi:glucokinase